MTQQPITPMMLRLAREQRIRDDLEEKATLLVEFVPSVLKYDQMMECMLEDKMLFDLRVQWTDKYDLNRLEEVVRPRLQPYMSTLIDPAHYDWALERTDQGHLKLRVVPRPSPWALRLARLSEPEEAKAVGAAILERLALDGETGIIRNDMDGLYISWDNYLCHVVRNGAYIYRDEPRLLLATRHIVGLPETVAITVCELASADRADRAS